MALKTSRDLIVMGSKYTDCSLGLSGNVATIWRLTDGVVEEVFTAPYGPSVIGKPFSTNVSVEDLYLLGNTVELDVEDFKIPDGYRSKFGPHDQKSFVRARQSLSTFHTVSVLSESGGDFKEIALIGAGGDVFLDAVATTEDSIFSGGENSSKPFLIRMSVLD